MWYFVVLAVIAVAVLSITIYVWRRPEQRGELCDEEDNPENLVRFRRFVNNLPVTFFQKNEKEFVVGYQGGKFILRYIPYINSVEMIDPSFIDVSCEDLPFALLSANTINSKSNWNCYASGKDLGKKEKPFEMNISCLVPLADEDMFYKLILSNMNMSFYIERDFVESYENNKRGRGFAPENLPEYDFRNKIELASNAWETMPHKPAEDESDKEVNGGPLKLSRLIALWKDFDFGKPLSLRVLAEGKMEKFTDEGKILNFDIYDFIRDNHTQAWADDFALQLTMENAGLLFCLRRSDQCTDKTLFYRMNIYRTGLKNNYNSEAYFCEMRIEVRLTTLDNDLWETKYMVEEALSKEKTEGFDNLSEMDKAIVAMATDSLKAHMYWGKRYYTANCLYQSLEHFMFIFRHCRDNWKQLNARGRSLYFEVAFYIGFIYMDLRMMESAHYFLEIAAHTQNSKYVEELINCLCNMKDPAALEYIAQCVNNVNSYLSDRGPDDGAIAFREFLERRFVYAQIDMGFYDEARQRLNNMIERGVNVDFAETELKYLDSLLNTATDEVVEEPN